MDRINKELNLNSLSLKDLQSNNTALIIVDMVVGFVEEGMLSSPRVGEMATRLLALNNKTKGYSKIFFIDSHNESSEELKSYPTHCLINTKEEELIIGLKDSLNKEDKIKVIRKNSTNGFHVPEFKEWLEKNISHINNFIIVGCVTDICIMQFALTLKTYFNHFDISKRVIIPSNAVETFDIPGHPAEEMNLFALANMQANGIEVVTEII